MKTKAVLLVIGAAVFCSFAGCEHKNKSDRPVYSNAKVQMQNSESYEDALKECFNATYSLGGGEVFYEYMYPDEAINAMKESGDYDKLVAQFNLGQESQFADNSDKLTFDKITDSHDINETQVTAVKSYLKNMCAPFVNEITEDQFDVKEGYEVNYTYLNNGEEAGTDTVLVIRLNDEGWKVITG